MPVFCLHVKAFFSCQCCCFFVFMSKSSCQHFVFRSKLCFHHFMPMFCLHAKTVFVPVLRLPIEALSTYLFLNTSLSFLSSVVCMPVFCLFCFFLLIKALSLSVHSSVLSSCQSSVFMPVLSSSVHVNVLSSCQFFGLQINILSSPLFFFFSFLFLCLRIKSYVFYASILSPCQKQGLHANIWSETSKLFFKPVFCLHVKAWSLSAQGSILSSRQSFVFLSSRQHFVFMSKFCLCQFKAAFCLHVKVLSLSVQGSILSSCQSFAILSNAFFTEKALMSRHLSSHRISRLHWPL